MSSAEATLVLGAISALGVLGAAVAAWLSARATKRAAEAQLFSALYSEYGASDMLRALRILRAWRSDQGDEFEVEWKRRLDRGDLQAQEVDGARRRVKHYFIHSLRLYEAGYVSKRLLKELGAVDGVNILYDIVEPLEYALNANYDHARFARLRKICGRARSGRLMAPVPPPSDDFRREEG